MAATILGVSTPSSVDSAATYASGSFTPAANDLLTVIVGTSASQDTAVTVTSSITGLTFSRITGQLRGTTNIVQAYVANGPAPAVAQTVTANYVTSTQTGTNITVLRTSGMTRWGLNAIRQSAVAAGAAATPPAAVFSGVALTGNAIIGAVHTSAANPPNVTPPTSFTERDDFGYATPSTGQETATRDSGHTSATVTWGSVAGSVWAAITLELDATLGPNPPRMTPYPQILPQ